MVNCLQRTVISLVLLVCKEWGLEGQDTKLEKWVEGEIIAQIDPEYPKFKVLLLRQWARGFEEGWRHDLLFNDFHDPWDVWVVKRLDTA